MSDKARCDDCGRVTAVDDLNEPKRLTERLDPGGTVPAGECPHCGALAYPVDPSEELTCRTMGANLHMQRIEFEALLAHLQEEGPPTVIRRRLEVLLGEKTLDEVDADEQRERFAEPAYTVVGTSGKGGPPYTVTVYTRNGPEAAMTLAHEAHGRERGDKGELQLVAIFADEPKLIDFDKEETWPGAPSKSA